MQPAFEQVASATPAHDATILIVDDDPVACRFLERALRRERSYAIEIAHDAAAALEVLKNTVVDLLLLDVGLPDTDGFKFVRRLRREPRLAELPIAIVSADARIVSKVAGFQLGIDDYFVKPIQIAEFVARIDAILERSATRRSVARKRKYNLAGDFTGISFADLTNMFTFGQRSGVLSIVTPRAAGRIVFVRGEPHQITFGNLDGPEAFYRLFAEPVGQFEFAPDDFADGLPERRVFQPSMSLLMEAARLVDEDRDATPGAKAGRDTTSPRVASLPVPTRRVAVALTEPALAALAAGLEDPFTLGELALLTPERLAAWSGAESSAQRFHVVVVGNLAAGACALASLASPMSEAHLATALTEHDLSLALTFELKGGVTAEVSLLDENAPAARLANLRVSPNVLLVAPSHGDWYSLGVEERVELAELLGELQPQCVLGIGNDSLSDGLEETAKLAGARAEIVLLAGSFDEAGFDFREALLGAVRALSGDSRRDERGGRAA
ncbi:MAG: response regulator [Planctomycetes bacterium]|nr:response regulator [Planctomycetota bacterium]